MTPTPTPKRAGRPAHVRDKDDVLSVRIASDLKGHVSRYATARGRSVSDAVSVLLAFALSMEAAIDVRERREAKAAKGAK